MWSFTLRMIRHTGCRDLRPVELEYLRSVVRKSDGGDLPRAMANGVHLASRNHRQHAPADEWRTI
jgi:hypothetical protein